MRWSHAAFRRGTGPNTDAEPVATSIARHLMFGDLHGRILPASRPAMRWERDDGARLDGMLPVGDLGYVPLT